ncbi:MAG: glycerate kinase family protein [Luteibaculaceae bacterium]
MKILVAPNAFKGTLESYEAAEIIAQNLPASFSVDLCPIADGGDSTCMLLGKNLGLTKINFETFDPLGRKHVSFCFYDALNEHLFIDVSSATGVKYVKKEERNPKLTSTYGTGFILKEMFDNYAIQKVTLGLGGSSTIDLGLGILQALGVAFYNDKGTALPPFESELLFKIKSISAEQIERYSAVKFEILCDVKNTFFGSNGAIPVFGPQKGVTQDEFPIYTKAAEHIFSLFKKHNPNLLDKEGFGAAGGIAMGISTFFNTTLVEGSQYFFRLVDMEERIKNCAILITGEGRYDSQSEEGKGSYALLQWAKKMNKRSVLITSGTITEAESGFSQVIRLPDLNFTKADYKERAKENLASATKLINLS